MAGYEQLVAHLADTDTVTIVTRRDDGTEVATPIWVVVSGGVPYARSEYDVSGKWYQHATSGRTVEFALGDGKVAETDKAAALAQDRVAVRAEHVPVDDADQAAVDEAFAAKYAYSADGVTAMTADGPKSTTLRFLGR